MSLLLGENAAPASGLAAAARTWCTIRFAYSKIHVAIEDADDRNQEDARRYRDTSPGPNDVLYEKHDDFARITLNRSTVLNAMNKNIQHLLYRAVERAESDDEVSRERLKLLNEEGGWGAFLKNRDSMYRSDDQ